MHDLILACLKLLTNENHQHDEIQSLLLRLPTVCQLPQKKLLDTEEPHRSKTAGRHHTRFTVNTQSDDITKVKV